MSQYGVTNISLTVNDWACLTNTVHSLEDYEHYGSTFVVFEVQVARRYLDGLRLDVRLPHWFAEDHSRGRYQVPVESISKVSQEKISRTYSPRAPCLSSRSKTRYRSEVSKVVIIDCRSSRECCPLNDRYLILKRSKASATKDNTDGDCENMRNFSSAPYVKTWMAAMSA